ncbi:hypothetical protein HDU83_006700 [Entophlyctis luteolus]|nr:hypothetical protein HDU83_006700 [Entophlyctis luteolus]
MACAHLLGASCSGTTYVDVLLAEARLRKYTGCGEMFSAFDLAALAKHAGLFTHVLDWDPGDTRLITRVLCAGGLCLVAYDKDGNNEPCFRGGAKAHWALVHGAYLPSFLSASVIRIDRVGFAQRVKSQTQLFRDSNTATTADYTSAANARWLAPPNLAGISAPPLALLCVHGKSRLHTAWRYDDLRDSCRNLHRVSDVVLRNASMYVLPDASGSLQESLCGKVVAVFPPSMTRRDYKTIIANQL